MLLKKHVLRDFTKFTGKHLCQSLFFNKETLAQVFACEFCEISKNTFFTEHLWMSASIVLNDGIRSLVWSFQWNNVFCSLPSIFFQVSIFFKKFSKIRMFFTSLKKCRYEIPVFFVVISCFHSYMGVFQLNRFLLDINFWILGVIEGLSLNFSLYFQSFL